MKFEKLTLWRDTAVANGFRVKAVEKTDRRQRINYRALDHAGNVRGTWDGRRGTLQLAQYVTDAVA